ncbi:MAG: aldehyde dehydrogenase family protein [Pseudomonadota bacterium]
MNVAAHFDAMSYGPAPEADDAVRSWLAERKAFGHFVDGAFTDPGELFVAREPATGNEIARLTQGTADDVAAAVAAAREAQSVWAALPGHDRARHLYALARMVQRHARMFAVLEAIDNGKTVRETRDIDIPLVARHFYHHAGWAQLQESEFKGLEPVGVVGQIVPWNFPLLMLAWKVAPALALGNTVVLKPAEYTSLTALLFAELAATAGLPSGVLNIVTGNGETGRALVESDVDKIAFTGSTEVGREIRQATAGSGKALTLELGGKSPFIIFEDADLDGAVEGVVDAIWFNQGEVCCAGSRLLVQESVSAEFYEKLLRRMSLLRIGDPLDKAVDMGALADPVQKARIEGLVAEGAAEGATVHQPVDVPAGCYYPPTLITDAHPTSRVATEEIFGPVAVAMTFRTPDEAIQLANHSRYGLAASVWSENIGLALHVAARVSAGVVWVNATNLFDEAVGFGGKRESGFGREGGREGAYAYLQPAGWRDRALREPVTVPDPQSATTVLIDRTAKLYVGGKQARPDGNYSRPVISPAGMVLGEVGEGNRKDIRNAVAAARGAAGWSDATAHNRGQVLYYLGENLAVRSDEFAARLKQMTGKDGRAEVEKAIERLFHYAAYADKVEGTAHRPPLRGLAVAIPEPQGVVGLICPPRAPLLGLIGLLAPLIAMGNRVVAVPSEPFPLAATDFYQVLETSDVPGGVVNIVTGAAKTLAKTLAEHDDVDAVWAFGDHALSAQVEAASVGNLKRTLVDEGRDMDVCAPGVDGFLLRHAVDLKNVWIPYGE